MRTSFNVLASLLGLCLVAAAGKALLTPPVSRAAAPPSLTVSTSDLQSAGFTRPVVQAPSGSRFQVKGVSYFRVGESVAGAEQGTTNLVAVSILPTPWSPDAVTGGTAQTNDFSGRASVCNSRAGYYFCVIGPDAAKVGRLADLLKSKTM